MLHSFDLTSLCPYGHYVFAAVCYRKQSDLKLAATKEDISPASCG